MHRDRRFGPRDDGAIALWHSGPDASGGIDSWASPPIERKLHAALVDITADPYLGKALRSELTGLRSFRVGKFRTIYRIRDRGASDRAVELVAFGPRSRIYEETYRLVARGQ